MITLGPPKVSFTWRHWAHWTGPYRDSPPTGELMELIGTAIAEVDDNLKIIDLQVFFDPNPMLAKMTSKACSKACVWRLRLKARSKASAVA